MSQQSLMVPSERDASCPDGPGPCAAWYPVAPAAHQVGVEARNGAVSSLSLDKLCQAINTALSHTTPVGVPAPGLAVPTLSDDRGANGILDLTGREIEVLACCARGLSNAEAGRGLHIGEDTIKSHLRRVYRKLRARDRAHAVAIAMRAGVLS